MKNDDEILNNSVEQLNQINDNIYDQIKVHKKKYYLYLFIGLVTLIVLILLIVLIIVLKDKKNDSEQEEEEKKENDKVESLPDYGYNKTFYSGYLKASKTKFFHYVYIEADEEPQNKPLVLWLNGGPGCSSLNGWGMEHGPYIIKENENNFTENIYSWNKEANIIYLESPVKIFPILIQIIQIILNMIIIFQLLIILNL